MDFSVVNTSPSRVNSVTKEHGQMIAAIDKTTENNDLYIDFYDSTSGTIKRHLMSSSNSGSKHVIVDSNGNPMTPRDKMKFVGGVVEDDSVNSQTVVYLWNAWVNITTHSASLYGATITVTKDNTVVGTTQFSNQGTATFMCHEPGTYTFSVSTE